VCACGAGASTCKGTPLTGLASHGLAVTTPNQASKHELLASRNACASPHLHNCVMFPCVCVMLSCGQQQWHACDTKLTITPPLPVRTRHRVVLPHNHAHATSTQTTSFSLSQMQPVQHVWPAKDTITHRESRWPEVARVLGVNARCSDSGEECKQQCSLFSNSRVRLCRLQPLLVLVIPLENKHGFALA
jgi:hypothetical protein